MALALSARTKPARLWLEPERRYPNGKLKQAARWIIRDGERRFSTGCGAGDRAGAEAALAEYIVEAHAAREPEQGAPAALCAVADVVAHYAKEVGTSVARPRDLSDRLGRLLAWWGDKSLADVSGYACRQYTRYRQSESSARRELEDLKAAITLFQKDGFCRENVEVTLPDKSESRVHYFTRSQVAAMVWHCWRYRQPQRGKATPRRSKRHLIPFILTAVYTGTRSRRIWTASFEREKGLPWIDLERGVYYREAMGEKAPDNKRAGSIRIPGRLLAHMRRWSKTRRYLVEWNGKPSDPKLALSRLMDLLFGSGHPYVRHTFRHTSATWLMWSGEDLNDIASFLSMSRKVLDDVYGHHHPDADKSVGEAFTSGRAGNHRGSKSPLARKGRVSATSPVSL